MPRLGSPLFRLGKGFHRDYLRPPSATTQFEFLDAQRDCVATEF